MLRQFRSVWLMGLFATAVIIFLPILLFVRLDTQAAADPWLNVVPTVAPTDHTALLTGPYESGREVTQACLECHTEAGQQMTQNVH